MELGELDVKIAKCEYIPLPVTWAQSITISSPCAASITV